MTSSSQTIIANAIQIAVVTGGNRGIGKEVCRQLFRDGYQVVLGSRDIGKGTATAQEIMNDVSTTANMDTASSAPDIYPIQLDVTSQESVDNAVKNIADRFGGVVDVLVNNAGINYDTFQRTTSVDIEFVKETFETNLYGPWRCTMGFLQLLEKSKNARIVNVSSGSGQLTGMGSETPAYGVSKAALNALTLKLAAELPHMKVNAVCPGWINTDMGGPGGGPIDRGGASVLWACNLSKDGPTGGFFRNGKRLDW